MRQVTGFYFSTQIQFAFFGRFFFIDGKCGTSAEYDRNTDGQYNFFIYIFGQSVTASFIFYAFILSRN